MKYLETLKNITKDNKRKRENLILLLVLLVILLISINYIFSSDENEEETNVSNNLNEQVSQTTQIDIEDKVAAILSEISGVSEVSVIINYSDEGASSIVYDTKEIVDDSGNITSQEKTVAYNEEDGDKTAIIQMYTTPTVEGVIVVAKGVESSELKQKIATALANLLGIASYKIQVFEK